MNITGLLKGSEWDYPFFKVLARNDTGEAQGHQSGLVLPKDLRDYMPALEEHNVSQIFPTVDRILTAELYKGRVLLDKSSLRYQIQTWGGKRTPEARITAGIRTLTNLAKVGDILVFQRRIDSVEEYRLILIERASAEYRAIERLVAGRKWGPLNARAAPITIEQFSQAKEEMMQTADKTFRLQAEPRRISGTGVTRIARDSAFREVVKLQYAFKCSISGYGLSTQSSHYEVEAAHIVPKEHGGPDDPRNGLCLTRTLHWAFDRGLIGVTTERRVFIPEDIRSMPQNDLLLQFDGRPLAIPKNPNLAAHEDALAWHRTNVVRALDHG